MSIVVSYMKIPIITVILSSQEYIFWFPKMFWEVVDNIVFMHGLLTYFICESYTLWDHVEILYLDDVNFYL